VGRRCRSVDDRDDHAAVRAAEVDAHLDETWFSWYGGTGTTPSSTTPTPTTTTDRTRNFPGQVTKHPVPADVS
jgi:hypothetical protein